MQYDWLIVGAGYTGAVMARALSVYERSQLKTKSSR